jgi:probable phosphoglycerate mutase
MQGHQDSPLTELGIRQATWLRDALHDIEFDGIYASSSPRAKKTAEIIRDQRSCEVIGCDDLNIMQLSVLVALLFLELKTLAVHFLFF